LWKGYGGKSSSACILGMICTLFARPLCLEIVDAGAWLQYRGLFQ